MEHFEGKANRKTPSRWDINSERALLEVWQNYMGQLRGCRKNSHILQEMAADLQKLGYNYTAGELKTKMHNVTARFRKEKQKIGTTGGSPSDWDLFKDVEMLLAPCKSINTEFLVLDSINNIDATLTCDILTNEICPPSPPIAIDEDYLSNHSADAEMPSTSSKKRRKTKEYVCKMEKKIDILIEIEKNKEAIEERKENLLKNFVEREAEVQNALIEFLRKS
ncbi:uncharacterized protein isoform X2 [Musca autumnalis]